MYLIVNYDNWEKYPRHFSDFLSAHMIYEILGDDKYRIEYVHDDGFSEIVWEKSFEEVRLTNGRRSCGAYLQ